MKVLEEYMKENGLMPVDLAMAIGVYPQTIYYWLNGKRRPSEENAKKLAAWSAGKLKAEDLLNDPA